MEEKNELFNFILRIFDFSSFELYYDVSIFFYVMNYLSCTFAISMGFFGLLMLNHQYKVFKKIIYTLQIIVCLLYFLLSIRFYFLQEVDWNLDFVLWCFFESFAFTVMGCHVLVDYFMDRKNSNKELLDINNNNNVNSS